jgi:hypothetical protein
MPTTGNIIYFLSNKRPLYEGLSSFLQSRHSMFEAQFIDAADSASVERFEPDLCEILLCDINDINLLQSHAGSLFDRVPAVAPLIGIDAATGAQIGFSEPSCYVRLAGITSLKKGWNDAWDNIVEMHRVWKTPIMHSRIEDVSPSDVLQMIGVSQWTAVVRVEGCRSESITDNVPDTRVIKGCISFSKGIPDCAWSTHHIGMEAILELLALKSGVLDVVRRIGPGRMRNVRGTIEEILITHALGMDESIPDTAMEVVHSSPQNPPPPIHWPEQGPKHTLDGFWKKNRDAITASFRPLESRICPLRMMKWRELERLVVSEIQTQFLVFFGDAGFIHDHMRLFAHALVKDKIADDMIPAIRIGKIGHSVLYLIGIREFDTSMRVLSRFPFIIHRDHEGFSDRLSMILKTGIRAAILISSEPEPCLKELIETAADREINACCISAARSPADIAGFFISAAEALSQMAVEKPA